MNSRNAIPCAAIQQQCGADREANLAATAELIEQAAGRGARLVVLQELHGTPYFCQTEDVAVFDLAEPVPGPTTSLLGELAAQHDIVIVGSVFERRLSGVYHNTAVVLDSDGSLAGRYRKMHIPDDPGFYEKFYFTPGDGSPESFRPIETSVGHLGVLVCWDQWYPEAARLMALAGAEVLIYPTAIGWDPNDDAGEQARQLDAWVTVQRSHAIANNLPVIAANRHGHEDAPSGDGPGIDFWGHSFICGPQGEFLARADGQGDQVLLATIDPARTESVRRIWPYLRDRRVDAYSELTRRVRD
ncbi:N-carbamoylputrescine amidase [Halospina denitrificans]|uniref:N-carbamoylputrescine amidase n=1 Tax=Halospina denitrificans TaxID=332522 RepID=A0A4R7JMY5_9GAMM|nr:carbon-nitrogen hydrolase [Halospina denitrificans]TDT39440.1 N-carbamoylputrescine amidase [Halospina denitrificans]